MEFLKIVPFFFPPASRSDFQRVTTNRGNIQVEGVLVVIVRLYLLARFDIYIFSELLD